MVDTGRTRDTTGESKLAFLEHPARFRLSLADAALSITEILMSQHMHNKRHLVECFISKLKRYRPFFTRFAESERRFCAPVRFTAALICIRQIVNRTHP